MKILEIGRGRDFRILNIPTPEPGQGEVLIRIEAVTTCPQWDLHLRHDHPMFAGHTFHYPYTPGQPGHEASGVIAGVGPGVTQLAIGDRVSVWRDTGHTENGCYAQYAVRPVSEVIRIPDAVTNTAAAPIELAMCLGVTFLTLKAMNALQGRRVGIMGLGPAGLVALQMARAEGACSVTGFDLSKSRRDLASKLGADTVVDMNEPTQDAFPARPATPVLDTSIDCVGASKTVEWLMDRTVDTVSIFGVLRDDVAFSARHWGSGLRLCGYGQHSREAAEYAVKLMQRGVLDLAPLVTRCMRLEDYADAIDLLERQEAIKVCFEPWR